MTDTLLAFALFATTMRSFTTLILTVVLMVTLVTQRTMGGPPPSLDLIMPPAWTGEVIQTFSGTTFGYTFACSESQGSSFQQFGEGRINIFHPGPKPPAVSYVTCFGLPANDCYCSTEPSGEYVGLLSFSLSSYPKLASFLKYNATTPDGNYIYSNPANPPFVPYREMIISPQAVPIHYSNGNFAYDFNSVQLGEPDHSTFVRPCNHTDLPLPSRHN